MIELDVEAAVKGQKKPRRRKVYYAFYDHEGGRPHPVIRLGGKYLEAFGFKVGDSIDVTLDFGRIVITKVRNPSGEDKA
jgi:hypothetical protein